MLGGTSDFHISELEDVRVSTILHNCFKFEMLLICVSFLLLLLLLLFFEVHAVRSALCSEA